MKRYSIQIKGKPIISFQDGELSMSANIPPDGVTWSSKSCTKKLFEAMKEYYEQESLEKTKETTPNCGICEWELRVWNKNNEIIAHECTAQGHKLCRDCYNTKECKKLFQEEIDE